MIAVRLLIAITVYSVILLEVYSGAIAGPQWWIIPGGLVISVVVAMGIFGEQIVGGTPQAPKSPFMAALWTWAVVLSVSFGMSAFSNYFGRELLPGEMKKIEEMRSKLSAADAPAVTE